MLKKILLFCFLIPVIVFVGSKCWSDSLPIQLAGFAFRGDSCQIKKNYPFVFSLSEEKLVNGQGILDKELCDRLTNIQLKGAHFIRGSLSKLGGGTLTLACCLDNETVIVDKYENGYKIVIDLGAQLLLFDYDNFKLELAAFSWAIAHEITI